MVQHIVMWKFKEDVDKEQAAAQMKEKLEALVGVVPGLLEARVVKGFDGFDVSLPPRHESREALAAYQEHPAHVAVKGYVHSVVCERVFCDGEI